MKAVKIISTKRTVLASADTVTTIRAKVSGYPRFIVESYPQGVYHKKWVTFRFDNAPEDMDFASWIAESCEYGMRGEES